MTSPAAKSARNETTSKVEESKKGKPFSANPKRENKESGSSSTQNESQNIDSKVEGINYQQHINPFQPIYVQ